MTATGFAYAPNEALQARMAHLAAEGKLVLGDAQDPQVLACMHKARFLCTEGALPHCSGAAGHTPSHNLTCNDMCCPINAEELAQMHACICVMSELCLVNALA